MPCTRFAPIIVRLAATLAVLLPALPAQAQSSMPDWAQCTVIESDEQRLACFDQIASRDETAMADAPARTERDGAAEAVADPESTAESWFETSEPIALQRRIHSEQVSEHNPFAIRGYRPNYIMPATYTPTDLSQPVYDFKPQHAETKFQLSFQFDWFDRPLGPNTAFYFGYTQLSLWQTYNTTVLGEDQDASSPFRETNYKPEVGLNIDTSYHLAGLTIKRMRLSVLHSSNGQGGERSRSWNRLVGGIGFGRGNLAGQLRGWYRLPESDKDDNPDITDYMGHGDLVLAYKWNRQVFSATLRNNLQFSDNRGAIQLDYSFPLSRRVKGYLQYFNGYGESLIDYNRSISRIGVGIALTDWL